MPQDRYDDYSAWAKHQPEPLPALTGNIRTDIVVIGGGFTGLSTALRLREQGRDVVVIEAEFCGAGASGRNAGQLEPTISRDLAFCLERFGTEKGTALANFAADAVYHTESLMAEHQIECDYVKSGNLCVGVHPSQRATMVRAAEITAETGLDIEFIPEDGMRQKRMPSKFLFGLKKNCGGMLDPFKLVQGLREAALAAGVTIYENSAALEINEDAPVTVKTEKGSVTADQLMLATNAYTVQSLKRMQKHLIPLRTTQYQTSPLTTEQLERIGWPEREAITTAHESLENYRLTADNRLVGGSKWVWYGYGSTLATGRRPATFAKYDDLLRVRFPELPDLKIEKFWGGWFSATPDLLPLCGVTGPKQNIFYSLGYNGHGLGQANYMGDLMALEMCGQPQEPLRVLDRKMVSLPPEPIRWLAVKAMEKKISWPDKKIDRELANSSA